MDGNGAGVLPGWAVLVLLAAGAGGVPLSCPPDTICLQDYSKERFHPLNIECGELTVILREDGDFFGRNVSYDGVRRCLTWRDGILSDCVVTETDENGRTMDLSITYLCTADALNTPGRTAGTLPPSSAPPGSTRPHPCVIAALVLFALLLLIFLSSRMRVLQRIYQLSGHSHTINLHHSSAWDKDDESYPYPIRKALPTQEALPIQEA